MSLIPLTFGHKELLKTWLRDRDFVLLLTKNEIDLIRQHVVPNAKYYDKKNTTKLRTIRDKWIKHLYPVTDT